MTNKIYTLTHRYISGKNVNLGGVRLHRPNMWMINLRHKNGYQTKLLIYNQNDFKKVYETMKNKLDSIIKQERSSRNILNKEYVTRAIGNHSIGYYKIGGVPYNKEKIGMSSLFDSYYELFIHTLSDGKRPISANYNCLGIEIEFMSKETHEFWKKKLVTDNYLRKKCQVKSDGSLRSNYYRNQVEICLLCDETNYEKEIGKLCDIINKEYVAVNRTCGLHVHLDMRQFVYKCFAGGHETKEQHETFCKDLFHIWKNFVAYEDILYAVQPTSRGSSTGEGSSGDSLGGYCQRIPKDLRKLILDTKFDLNDNLGHVNKNSRLGRYMGISTRSLFDNQTIEFRMGSGSTNSTKIINWIKLLLAIRYKQNVNYKIHKFSIETLKDLFGDNNYLISYFIERYNTFRETSSIVYLQDAKVVEDNKLDHNYECMSKQEPMTSFERRNRICAGT